MTIHAQEDRQTAEEKLVAVTKKLKAIKAAHRGENSGVRGMRDTQLLRFSDPALAIVEDE